MEQSYPFDTGAGANVLEGEWQRMATLWRDSGVALGRGGDLRVTADGGGMYVNVAPGEAWVRGFHYYSDAVKQLPIGAADATNPRVDRVVARLDRAANAVTTLVLQGVPAASPVGPVPEATDLVHDVFLAEVRVNAAVGVITAADVVEPSTNTRNSGLGNIDSRPSSSGPDTYPPGVSTFPVSDLALGYPAQLGTVFTVAHSTARGWQTFSEKISHRVWYRSADQAATDGGWSPWQQVQGAVENLDANSLPSLWPEGVSASYFSSAAGGVPLTGTYAVLTVKRSADVIFQLISGRDSAPEGDEGLWFRQSAGSDGPWGPWQEIAFHQDHVNAHVSTTDTFTNTVYAAPPTIHEVDMVGPPSGAIEVTISARMANNTAGQVTHFSFEVVRLSDNVVVVSPSVVRGLSLGNTALENASFSWPMIVAAGVAYRIKARVAVSGGTGTISGRYISAKAV